MRILNNFNSLGKKAAGGFLLVIGLTASFFIIKTALLDFPIWFFGQRVTGVVEEKWYELESEVAGEKSFSYHLRYNFLSSDGETLTNSSSLSAQEWSALSPGNDVLVVYSPLNPENNRVDDSRFVPLLFCSYIPFIILAWLILKIGWKLLYAEFKESKADLWILGQPLKNDEEQK